MKRRAILPAALLVSGGFGTLNAQATPPCEQHSRDCPKPPIINAAPLKEPVPAPSDAIVLFDGTSLADWRSGDGSPARWKVKSGYLEVVPGTGTLMTARGFGDVQLHVEWASPAPPKGEDQNRGNSGIFLMGRYEVQVLDSYGSLTYSDGQAGALYGQYPPLVNASLPPGVWQSYDIVFRRPRFASDGKLLEPAIVTVFHNGVLIQNGVVLTGATAHTTRPPYEAHADRLPITLQDHEHPVRFRNIWVRELER